MWYQRASTSSQFFDRDANVEISVSDIALVNEDTITRTIERAKKAPRGRARILLHQSEQDLLHEMLIVLPRYSCDVPHINYKSGKSFFIIKGEMAVIYFSEDGTVARRVILGDNKSERMIRLNKPFWHTIIPLTDYVVFLETITGPFTGNQFASWAPSQDDSERWDAFVKYVRELAES